MAARIISRLTSRLPRTTSQVPFSTLKVTPQTSSLSQLTNHLRLHRPAFIRFKHSGSGETTIDIKTNIIATITQKTTLVTLESLLYHATNFHQVLDCMLEVGFKEDEIIDLFISTPQLLNCKGAVLEDTIRFFRGEGFSVRQTYLLLKRSPGVVGSQGQVSELITFLRAEIKLPDSNLQEVLTTHPELLFSSADVLASNYKVLMEVFRRSDIMRMIRKDPLILLQTESEVDAKVNYIYHKMGQDQVEMVWANILCYDLEHIQARHELMERLGRFEKPDRKGVTKKPNPYLKDLLSGSDSRFAKMAGITVEEFDVFKRLIKIEKENRVTDFNDELNEGVNTNEDGDSEEEEEGKGHLGYRGEMKRRERRKKIIVD